jgi:hypothetical protein
MWLPRTEAAEENKKAPRTDDCEQEEEEEESESCCVCACMSLKAASRVSDLFLVP